MIILLLNIIIRLYIVTYLINFFFTSAVLTSFIQLTDNNQQIFSTYLIPSIITLVLLLSFFVRNPIYTLLLVLFGFIMCSILVINVSSELLAYIFLIVYLGAVMMLFLFVVMLFNLSNLKSHKKSNSMYNILFILFTIIFLFDMQNTILFVNSVKPFFDVNFLNINALFYFLKVTTNNAQAFNTLYLPEGFTIYILITNILIFGLICAISIALITKNDFYRKNYNYFKNNNKTFAQIRRTYNERMGFCIVCSILWACICIIWWIWWGRPYVYANNKNYGFTPKQRIWVTIWVISVPIWIWAFFMWFFDCLF